MVLTDEPDDFAGLPVRAIRHAPTGPMAVDYLTRLPLPAGEGRAAAAYHEAVRAPPALEDFDTALYVDADSRFTAAPRLGVFPPGLAVLQVVRASVAEHLETWRASRKPSFVEFARHLTGNANIFPTTLVS